MITERVISGLFNFRDGCKVLYKRLITLRFEAVDIDCDTIDPEIYDDAVLKLRGMIGPLRSSVKKRALLHVFLYHILHNYKGWCYIRNLPINGQRTWSNAWTAHRCNTLLKKYLLRRGRTYYGNLHSSEIFTAYLAECVNKK